MAKDRERQRRRVRARKVAEARDDRYAFVVCSVDRKTNLVTVDHPFLSLAEAWGIVHAADEALELTTSFVANENAEWGDDDDD